MIAADLLAPAAQKQRAVVRFHREFRTRFPDVLLHPGRRAVTYTATKVAVQHPFRGDLMKALLSAS